MDSIKLLNCSLYNGLQGGLARFSFGASLLLFNRSEAIRRPCQA